jgi:hypothetical protein
MSGIEGAEREDFDECEAGVDAASLWERLFTTETQRKQKKRLGPQPIVSRWFDRV